jgi:predicted Zn-dependent protease
MRPPIPPGEIPRAEPVSAADEQYGQAVLGQLTEKYPLERNDRDINLVRDIVQRLARAARADREPWNVYVLKGDSLVNAAATRGHYVFVWSGMLRTVQNDQELATVLAHELGHVLAGHTKASAGEEAAQIIARVSGQLARQAVLQQPQYGALAGIAGAVVTQMMEALLVNPESQRQEHEADQIGLFLMADAGYDPRAAIAIWTKLGRNAQIASSNDTSAFSSHPGIPDRIEAMKALLPRAVDRFERRTGRARPSRTGGRPPERPDPDDTFVIGRDP